MQIDPTRIFRRDKLLDQAIGLAVGIGVAVLTVVGAEVAQATDDELLDAAFWLAAVSTAIRSAVTAVLTTLGISIKGVSSG